MNAFGVGGEQSRGSEGAVGARGAGKAGEGEAKERWKRMGRGGVVVVDMPGYGAASREEWGMEIMKYLEGRKQYVLPPSIQYLCFTAPLVSIANGLSE